MTLEVSTLKSEGIYQGSKFLKHYTLSDPEDLKVLFEELKPFYIYPLTSISDGNEIPHDLFLSEYTSWIDGLKNGKVPVDRDLKKILACVMTKEKEALWKQEIPGNRYLIKVRAPCIQVQANFFTYSEIDGVFRPMTMGKDQIFWGLTFSFPQIYQEPKTMQLLEVGDSLNAEAFQVIKKWVRNTSRATPFIVNGTKTNVPIRLGKTCFSWIEHHPQLKKKKISVQVGEQNGN